MEKRKYLQPTMKEVHSWRLALLTESPPPGGGEDPDPGFSF